jgi:signal transduction histidine kinase
VIDESNPPDAAPSAASAAPAASALTPGAPTPGASISGAPNPGAPTDEEDARRHARAVGASIAVDVASELAEPLRALRDRLAILVDGIDKHVALSTGPTPYPWKPLQMLRQDLADAYLQTRQMARLAGDFTRALGAIGAPIGELDVNKEVEAAVNLVAYRIGPRTEMFVDLGQLPPCRGAAGELMLAVAQLVVVCAESAARVDGSAVSIRTRREDDRVAISVADNGGGAPDSAGAACSHVAAVAARAGGSFDGTSPEGQGSAFELRLPIA